MRIRKDESRAGHITAWPMLKDEPKTFPIAVFDTEGSGEDGDFVLGVVVDDRGEYVFKDREKMLKWLTSKRYRGYRVFAHNLEYDLAVLAWPWPKNVSPFFAGDRLITVRVKNEHKNPIIMWDSANITGYASVDRMGEALGMPKGKTPEYLKRPHGLPADKIRSDPKKMEEVAEYCAQDTRIVYEYLVRFQEEINNLGAELKPTIGSIALDLFRRKYVKERFATLLKDWNIMLRPYFAGGRTEVFVMGMVSNVASYDVHSMYPSVMRDMDLPHPNYLRYTEKSSLSIIEKYEGVSYVTIESPNLDPPLLHMHFGSALIFPVGEWEYAYTHAELRRALELGYKIKRVHWSLFSTRTIRPYRQMMIDLYQKRVELGAKDPIKKLVYKLLMNSAYGKNAELRQSSPETVYTLDAFPDDDSLKGKRIEIVRGRIVVREPTGFALMPFYANMTWAMYITAGARLKLYDGLLAAWPEVVYCDTDSVHSSVSIPTGPNLGEWGKEWESNEAQYLAPKLYRYRKPDGSWRYKAKGVPNSEAPAFFETGWAEYYKPLRTIEAIKRHMNPATWTKVVRTNRYPAPKRAPVGDFRGYDDTVLTRPYTVDEAIGIFGALGKPLGIG